MPASVEPVKGRWYYHPQTGRRLQVTWVDKGTELVEACDENGHTEFYPQAEWHALELEPQTDEPLLGEPRRDLSNEEYRRATGWAEKSPDDFPDG